MHVMAISQFVCIMCGQSVLTNSGLYYVYCGLIFVRYQTLPTSSLLFVCKRVSVMSCESPFYTLIVCLFEF